ncbi:putative F-box/LRR-repeat protein At3g58880 isoform X2 [Tasmannia lanceolata]|uniref:putative F-box/LRR-repeat protein At3g58880 isoform X2 n=1 Tax=Tasmannia lanceolata TaxID=3420 RepID=UPI004062A259
MEVDEEENMEVEEENMEVEEEEQNNGSSSEEEEEEEEEEENSDWEPNPEHCFITNLPDNLLIQILSFLPILDAINTSFLSRRWRYLWTLTPNLDFDQRLIVSETEDKSESRRIFAGFVDRALLLHEGSEINRLRIWFYFDHKLYESHLSSWIRFAILRNVKDLDLELERGDWKDNGFPQYSMPYLFNDYVFNRGSVRVLKLCLPGLDPTPDLRFGSITTLYLERIGLNYSTIPNLITFCPNLENLVLDHVCLMTDLIISSVKLKTLSIMNTLQMDGCVEIDAPNLLSLTLNNYVADDYILKDVSSLVEAVIIFLLGNNFQIWRKTLNGLTHVRRLKIDNLWWMEQQTGEFSEEILPYKFRYLELAMVLRKMELPGLAKMLEFSPNLETLVLENRMVYMIYNKIRRNDASINQTLGNDASINQTLDNNASINQTLGNVASEESYTGDDLEKVFTGSPLYLKKLKITSFLATDNELELVKYLLMYGVALEKIILVPDKTGLVSVPPQHLAERFQELQAFPRSSRDAEILLVQNFDSWVRLHGSFSSLLSYQLADSRFLNQFVNATPTKNPLAVSSLPFFKNSNLDMKSPCGWVTDWNQSSESRMRFFLSPGIVFQVSNLGASVSITLFLDVGLHCKENPLIDNL